MGCNAWNHPPSCNCGWGGVNYGSNSPNPLPNTDNWKRDAARRTLEKLNVRSYSTCYVAPNAACPVCGKAVYFYANDHGSRVYFDDLGPPWPKHGCTDKGRAAQRAPHVPGAPVCRPKADIRDILETARIANLPLGLRRSKKRKAKWVLHLVIEVKRTGAHITVLAESISDGQNSKIKFSILSKSDVIEEGDFVSKKGDTYSFLRKDTLEGVEILDGYSFDPEDDEDEQVIDDSVIPNSPSEMTQREFKYFHTPPMHVKKMTAKYTELLASLSKRNIIGPRLVAHYLNQADHTTAIGSPWTPRLAYFLISLVGAPMERTSSTTRRRAADKSQAQRHGKRKRTQQQFQNQAADEPLGIDDLVRKLSRLGRVTRQGD